MLFPSGSKCFLSFNQIHFSSLENLTPEFMSQLLLQKLSKVSSPFIIYDASCQAFFIYLLVYLAGIKNGVKPALNFKVTRFNKSNSVS